MQNSAVLVLCAAIGFMIAAGHAAYSYRRSARPPDFITFVEIIAGALGVAAALRCFGLAWGAPSEIQSGCVVGIEERIYFSVGAFALGWASVAAIVRKLLHPPGY